MRTPKNNKGKFFTVTLSSCGNPDMGQEPTHSKPRRVHVASLKEASDVCLAYIAKHNLGAGNWNGGEIGYIGIPNEVYAKVSYNGTVWDNLQKLL
jgi:hypothetical protein